MEEKGKTELTHGQRVRKLRKEHNLTQEQLAEMIEVTPDYIRMVEADKRRLSSKKAQMLADRLPPVRVAWLMCMDNFQTGNAIFLEHYRIASEQGEQINQALFALLTLNGYAITREQPQTNRAEDILSTIKVLYRVEKDGETITLSLFEWRKLGNEISDMFDVRMTYLMKEKANGQHTGTP